MLVAVFLAVFTIAPLAQAQAGREIRVLTPGADGSYLGVEMEDVTADNMANYKLSGERGVIVRSVEKGSPAEAANLQEKDVILEYAGTPVFSSTQFARLVRETPAGRKVDLVVSRDGKKLNLSAKIGQREAGPAPVGRGIEVIPDRNGAYGFNFGGPEGRTFEFHLPGGEGNAFLMPRGRSFAWSSEKPRLGVTLQPLTSQLAEFLGVSGKKGVLVASVVDNSPAVGKLKAGDVIISADSRTIENPEDLTSLLAAKDSQAKVELKIVRDKKEQTVVVELSKTDGESKKGGYRM
jgi:serine protease Do